jgi:hypothetical protein
MVKKHYKDSEYAEGKDHYLEKVKLLDLVRGMADEGDYDEFTEVEYEEMRR